MNYLKQHIEDKIWQYYKNYPQLDEENFFGCSGNFHDLEYDLLYKKITIQEFDKKLENLIKYELMEEQEND